MSETENKFTPDNNDRSVDAIEGQYSNEPIGSEHNSERHEEVADNTARYARLLDEENLVRIRIQELSSERETWSKIKKLFYDREQAQNEMLEYRADISKKQADLNSLTSSFWKKITARGRRKELESEIIDLKRKSESAQRLFDSTNTKINSDWRDVSADKAAKQFNQYASELERMNLSLDMYVKQQNELLTEVAIKAQHEIEARGLSGTFSTFASGGTGYYLWRNEIKGIPQNMADEMMNGTLGFDNVIFGQGNIDRKRVLVLGKRNLTASGRAYSYCFILDPGEAIWENVKYNGALLATRIMEDPILHDVVFRKYMQENIVDYNNLIIIRLLHADQQVSKIEVSSSEHDLLESWLKDVPARSIQEVVSKDVLSDTSDMLRPEQMTGVLENLTEAQRKKLTWMVGNNPRAAETLGCRVLVSSPPL